MLLCSKPFSALVALVPSLVVRLVRASDFIGHDCSLTLGEGMPYGRYGDGPKAAASGGGFCPVSARCQSNDLQCVPELGYGEPRTVNWGSQGKDNLAFPVALAFKPGKPCELWVVNHENSSFTIFFNPGSTSKEKGKEQMSETRQDIAGCHFHQKPSSISFGEDLPDDTPRFPGCKFEGKQTFLTTADDRNSYDGVGRLKTGTSYYGVRYGDDFMGPTLWSANLSEFAIKNNDIFPGDLEHNPDGGHLTMLHQSSFSMGSVWAGRQTTFWLWDAGPDSWRGSIVHAEILAGHGFGGSDHTHANMKRYDGIHIGYVPSIPGHMALGGGTWLYICDPGHGRLVRMDTASGTIAGDVKPRDEWREFYQSYSLVKGATYQAFGFQNSAMPCGIVYIEGRIYVADAASGKIMLLRPSIPGDEEANLSTWKVVRIVQTASSKLTGLALDSNHRLWFLDASRHQLNVLEPRCVGAESCWNRIAGNSPWADSCAPPTGENGQTLYENLLNKNVEDWGYNVRDMGGCARSFYIACPGGQLPTRPICEAVGGGIKDACVDWSGSALSCSCDRCDSQALRGPLGSTSSLTAWLVPLVAVAAGICCGCSGATLCVAVARRRFRYHTPSEQDFVDTSDENSPATPRV